MCQVSTLHLRRLEDTEPVTHDQIRSLLQRSISIETVIRTTVRVGC